MNRAALASWWQGRSGQERALLLVAALLVGVILLVQLVLIPAQDFRERGEAASQRSLDLYRSVLPLARQLASEMTLTPGTEPATLPVPDREAVRTTVTELARQLALDIERLTGTEEIVEIWFGAAEPESLFRWLERLETAHGIQATRAFLDRAEGDAVSGRITLERVE